MQWSPEELALKSLNDWWVDAGVTPDQPVSIKKNDSGSRPKNSLNPDPKKKKTAPLQPRRLKTDQVLEAQKIASGAQSPEELKQAIAAFKGCDLRTSARSTVVFDGQVNADIMVICGAPDREEDKSGIPASGQAGKLLDRMFAAIGLSRNDSLYIASLLPWHMLGERNPDNEEWAICRPFIQRQIELVAPKIIVTIGKMPSQMLLEKSDSIAKLRGQEFEYTHESLAGGIPCFPLQSPQYLLVRPAEKAKTWQDLQLIQRKALEIGAIKQS